MKKHKILLTIYCVFIAGLSMAQNTQDSITRFIKVPSGYLMVLRQGDNVISQIEDLVQREKIPSANFAGMGFVNVTFGYFNFETKQYKPRQFNNVELASMTGSIAWQDNKASLHTHGVVTDKKFKAFGGHILDATVSTGSVEILITLHDTQLNRVLEQPLGANVLNLTDE